MSNESTRRTVHGFVHLSEALEDFLDTLQLEVENRVEALGGFRGPIRPAQEVWSCALDEIANARQIR